MSPRAGGAIREALSSENWPQGLEYVKAHLSKALVSQAVATLYEQDPTLRWRAVEAVGVLTAALFQRDPQAARDVLRRLMWSLNEESGSIGWGAPGALAETMAREPSLAEEFLPVFFSRIQGAHLESIPPVLCEGFLWAMLRLWEAFPEAVSGADLEPVLMRLLDSPSASARAMAALALGKLHARKAAPALRALLHDSECFETFKDGRLVKSTVAETARQALEFLDK